MQGSAALTLATFHEATIASLPPGVGSDEPDIGSYVRTVLDILDDAKAEEIIAIDLAGKTSIADTMIIASGRSNTHVAAIADRVIQTCKNQGMRVPRVEGLPGADWVLVDGGDFVVHIFRPEVRQFYNLEKLWGVDRPGELKT